MSLSTSRLRAFEAVVANGSYTAAANALGMTQPAVTQLVAALARHVGVPLLQTVDRRLVPTEAGAFLHRQAGSVIRLLDQTERAMRDFAAGRAGRLRVGATLTIGAYVLPPLLARFRERYPQIKPEVVFANTAAVCDLLRAHELTLGLVEGLPPADLCSVPFAQDEIVLVLPAGDRFLPRRRRVLTRDLTAIPFVCREPGSGTRDLGYDAVVRSGVTPPIAMELPSGEAILHAVEAGGGAALLSRVVAQRARALGTVRCLTIADLPLERSFFAVRPRDRELSPAQRSFLRVVVQDERQAAAFERGSAPGS